MTLVTQELAQSMWSELSNIDKENCKNIDSICLDSGLYDQKDRYNSIRPFKTSYVTLDFHCPYINASWHEPVKGGVKYIACQCPMKNTMDEWLHMIVQYNVKLVCALGGRNDEVKVNRFLNYWTDEQQEFDTYTLIKTNVNDHDGWTETSFQVLKNDAVATTFNHLHFYYWPDYSAPNIELYKKFISFMYNNYEKLLLDNKYGYLAVHCSAGVGRTGTLLAGIALAKLYYEKTLTDDPKILYDIVYNLKKCRILSVTTYEQWAFLLSYYNYLVQKLKK